MLSFQSYVIRPTASVCPSRCWGGRFGMAAVAPRAVAPRGRGQNRLAMLAADTVFANASALAQTGVAEGSTVQVQQGVGTTAWTLAWRVAAGGPPLLVLDIAAPAAPGHGGPAHRVDLRLTSRQHARAGAPALGSDWPANARWHDAQEDEQAVSSMSSRAYRVNLTVLALVALFVGRFWCFR